MDKTKINVEIREDKSRSFDFGFKKDIRENIWDEKIEIRKERWFWYWCSSWVGIF
jgi:hypothetical protein